VQSGTRAYTGGTTLDDAIKRVILFMSARLDEPITVDDLAKTARFSKFYFTRLFRRETGVSPGRFLSAMRLEEAKRLLVSTSMRVADISHRVGYTSVGTFTTRFTTSVGVPPTRYRRVNGHLPRRDADEQPDAGNGTTVMAVVRPPAAEAAGRTFVGVYPSGQPRARPVRSTVLDEPEPCRFQGVPTGRWVVLCAFSDATSRPPSSPQEVIANATFVGVYGPLDVSQRVGFAVADITQESVRAADAGTVDALIDSVELPEAA